MTTQEYWRKIRAIAAGFDPEAAQKDREEEDPAERVNLRRSQKATWVTSVENPEKGSVAGQTLEMLPYGAAERIFAQTHRLATEEEIRREVARREEEKQKILKAEADRKQTVNTTVSIDPQQLAEAVVAASGATRPRRGASAE